MNTISYRDPWPEEPVRWWHKAKCMLQGHTWTYLRDICMERVIAHVHGLDGLVRKAPAWRVHHEDLIRS